MLRADPRHCLSKVGGFLIGIVDHLGWPDKGGVVLADGWEKRVQISDDGVKVILGLCQLPGPWRFGIIVLTTPVTYIPSPPSSISRVGCKIEEAIRPAVCGYPYEGYLRL